MYDRVGEFISIIQKYETNSAELQFCRAFIQKFTQASEVARIVAAGKLEMSKNKKEKTATFFENLLKDGLGLVGVPTNAVGQLADAVMSAALREQREKGYGRVAVFDTHATQIALTAQTLAFSLLIHYEDHLCSSKNIAARRGREAADRLIKSVKKNKIRFEVGDKLVQKLDKMLNRLIRYEYIHEADSKKPNEEVVSFLEDDIQTLMALSSAALLHLPLDCFVKEDSRERTIAELNAKASDYEQRLKLVEDEMKGNKKSEKKGNKEGSKRGPALNVTTYKKSSAQHLEGMSPTDAENIAIVDRAQKPTLEEQDRALASAAQYARGFLGDTPLNEFSSVSLTGIKGGKQTVVAREAGKMPESDGDTGFKMEGCTSGY